MQQTIVTIASLLAVANANPISLAKRDVISPALPQSADAIELDVQPLLDFDTDGCYNTAAITTNGQTNPGHKATGTPQGDCRDPHQLENSNVYSRKRCNNGYCAVMYEYYFEKDQAVGGSFLGGHRHDWENIVVFTKGNDVIRVAPSCHGKYEHSTNNFPKSGKHPMMVYHKDGGATHCFRVANDDDIKRPENYSGKFYHSPLVGWDHWPSQDLKNKMLSTWNGGVGPKLDDEFTNSLKNAAGNALPGFDPARDS